MGGHETTGDVTRCGLTEQLLFVTAIVAGTACSITSKTMMELHSVGITGEVEHFTKPLFQTFGMFIGMVFAMPLHWAVRYFKIPFPGYVFSNKENEKQSSEAMHGNGNGHSNGSGNGQGNGYHPTEGDSLLPGSSTLPQSYEQESANTQDVPVWMYFFLAIPALFDLGATVLCMCGLRYLDVSIYQMLRGSGIIFVALMKQHVLRHKLHGYQWVGVVYNVVSVVLVGATAMLAANDSEKDVQGGDAMLGVALVMAGAFVQSLQFVFEEKVMTMDIPAPPLLLIGMEGVWGTVICLFVLYPLAYIAPGDDHGSYEDPFNTIEMIKNSGTIQFVFFIYFFTILLYNVFACLVTFMLSSVWHAILDNFRPITVWGTDMLIFYCFADGAFGEPWTKWSYIQLGGMAVLLYGTAIYNAPNAGSVKLEGQWWALGLDFSAEYRQMALADEEASIDARFEELRRQARIRKGSLMSDMNSPSISSLHTQQLMGAFGSPKI